MKPIVLFKGAWLALQKNKKRSFLTMLGIVIGISAVSTIMSIGRGFENYTLQALNPENEDILSVEIQFLADDIAWMLETNEDIFTDNDLRMIEKLPEVEDVNIIHTRPDHTSFDTIINGEEIQIEASLTEEMGNSVFAGRALDLIDNEKKNRVVVIPYSLVKGLYNTEAEAIGNGLTLDGQLYTIVGVYENDTGAADIINDLTSQEIEIPKKTFYRYHEKNEDIPLNRISIMITEDNLPSDVAEKVVSLLEDRGSLRNIGSYAHFDQSILSDGLSIVLRSITLFIASVAGISLFIAGIGVMNMMYISVSERTKEIGIRRALGASQKNIRTQFVLEGVIMTSIGGIIGYLFGWLFSSIATLLLPFPTRIDAFTIIISISVSFFVGLIFSYAPASSASEKEIIDIL